MASVDAKAVIDAVQYREQLMSTGVGHGVAIPHARVEGVTTPVVAVGLSRAGIDFNAADGLPAHLIFLLLTPASDEGTQLEIISEITQLFANDRLREQALEVNSYTEFLALIKSEGAG